MQNYFLKSTVLTLLLFVLASFSFAQNSKFPEPREEKLLNGLNVLIWSQPNTKRVSVKLRIHSGSAFDPKDKEGTTALLAEILFPENGIKNFFEEDLEGKLEVVFTHNYIQINAEAKSDEFLAVIETIAPAVSNPQIDKEIFATVKERYLDKLKELENDPSYVADLAVAERLYGDFPYGRANFGTSEIVKTLVPADLIIAERKFLTADNATLTITGDVSSSYAYKAARRLLGGWQKSQKEVPANFRLPEEPETTPLIINVDEPNIWNSRHAMDFVSRTEKNYYAGALLNEILDDRFKKQHSGQNGLKSANVKNISNFLRGYIVFTKDLEVVKSKVVANPSTLDVNGKKTSDIPDSDEDVDNDIKNLFIEKITPKEFEFAKTKVLADLNNMSADDFWLEIQTYKLGSIKNELKKANAITLNEVQNISTKMSKNKVVEVNVTSIDEMQEPKKEIEEKPGIPIEIQDQDPKDPTK